MKERLSSGFTNFEAPDKWEVVVKQLFVGLLTLLPSLAMAQQQPPEIPVRFSSQFHKAAAGIIWARRPASPSIPRAMFMCIVAVAAARAPLSAIRHRKFSNSTATKISSAKLPRIYAWSFAHTVRIDKDDNIWATDKGSDMIVKISPQGRVLMVFGRKQEASEETEPHSRRRKPPLPPIDGRFRQPTDVTWDLAGNIYISDGYVNSRVAKLSKDGDWIKTWGTRGKGPGQFDLLHTIASDDQDNIYVGDRNNRRIQVFDTEGNFKRQITIDVPPPPDAKPAIGNMPTLKDYIRTGGTQTPGAPWAICITPGPHQVMYVSDSFPGRVYKLSLDGKVLGWLGRSGKQLKQFGWVHQIACPSENEIYVAEIPIGASKNEPGSDRAPACRTLTTRGRRLGGTGRLRPPLVPPICSRLISKVRVIGGLQRITNVGNGALLSFACQGCLGDDRLRRGVNFLNQRGHLLARQRFYRDARFGGLGKERGVFQGCVEGAPQ